MNKQGTGELLHNEPLSRYTTWRVGGPAERLYKPSGLTDLCEFLQQLPEQEPLFWLGLGSNLLVRDGGIRGTVIATQGALNDMQRVGPDRVRAEAGVSCAKVARFCSANALVGAEFLAGIPGTMGGAVAMNAGAFGGETWNLVDSVETIDRHGRIRQRDPADFCVGYRSVEGPSQEWFVAVFLKLTQVSEQQQQAIQQRMKSLLAQRNEKQPIGQPSCGSVFRNPPGAFAAELIERCGLKGQCIGGACVSEKHANFIINTGGASASDIENLIDKVEDSVYQCCGVHLQREVRIVGERLQTGTQTQ